VGKYATALVALIVVVVLVADFHDTPVERTGPWIAGLSVLACLLVAWSAVQYASSFASSARLGRRAPDGAGR
jgi:hypothetical protein